MKQYQASAKGDRKTADSPREAAKQFFSSFPSRRKCNIIEGKVDGHFFVVTYGDPWPASWKDVTKKTIETLPE